MSRWNLGWLVGITAAAALGISLTYSAPPSEANLQRLFDRELLDAFGNLAAMPSERVMLTNVVARSVALFRG